MGYPGSRNYFIRLKYLASFLWELELHHNETGRVDPIEIMKGGNKDYDPVKWVFTNMEGECFFPYIKLQNFEETIHKLKNLGFNLSVNLEVDLSDLQKGLFEKYCLWGVTPIGVLIGEKRSTGIIPTIEETLSHIGSLSKVIDNGIFIGTDEDHLGALLHKLIFGGLQVGPDLVEEVDKYPWA